MTEKSVKHLELVQSVVNRMAGNSMMMKGWTVTLVSALFALAAKDSNIKFIAIAYFPAMMFWVLDGYFLCQERLYRALYDKVRLSATESDFSMNTKGLGGSNETWPSSILSKTLVIFYGAVFATLCIVMFWALK